MSIVSVEDQVQSILDGQISPLFLPAQAWVRPPTFVYVTTPQIFVLATDFDDERHTIPRPTGQRRVTYRVTIWLQAATSSAGTYDQGTAASFPYLIDAVMNTLRTTPMPVPLVDGITGDTSVLQAIGEKISVKHPPPITATPQSDLLYHNATLTVAVTKERNG